MDNKTIRDFWQWFASVSDRVPHILEDETLVHELNGRVKSLGAISWEVGPPTNSENKYMFVLSPDGMKGLLDQTERIMELAPDLQGWEFHPAKPPKRRWGRKFNMRNKNGSKTEIDACDWTYGLIQYEDGLVEIIFKSPIGLDLDDSRKKTAAWIVVDAELGEAFAVRWVNDVEVVDEFVGEFARFAKSQNEIEVLREHISHLVSTSECK